MACDKTFFTVIKCRGITEIEIWMMRWYKKKKRKIPVPKSIAHHSNSPRSELLLPPNLRLVFVFVFRSHRSVTSNAVSAFHHLYRFVTSHRILNLFQISIAFLSPDLFFVFVFHLYRPVTFNAFNAFHHRYQLVTLLHQIWNLFQILIAFIFLPDVNVVSNPGSDPEIVVVVVIKQREDDESHLMISLPDVIGAVDGGYLRDGRHNLSRVQENIKNLLGLKTATGILMIELHHLGGGLPDPDGTLQQAGSRIDTEKAMKISSSNWNYGGEAKPNWEYGGALSSPKGWYGCAVSLPNWKDGDDVSIPNYDYCSKADSLPICGAVSIPIWEFRGESPPIY
ncbi:hypothetical protein SSS_05501 [Sarcoptes scabiei]|uniref:Uncharacterized protein n=1 Tax=Sarcoptes scabiei TaxID=52283 RepID=A0A834R7W2_SARSC|nr:hypothetical protein SSS_05501 [Sarcoptes scabiei]